MGKKLKSHQEYKVERAFRRARHFLNVHKIPLKKNTDRNEIFWLLRQIFTEGESPLFTLSQKKDQCTQINGG